MLYKILDAVKSSVEIPLYAAPVRHFGTCAVYRWFPLENDGAISKGKLEVKIYASSISSALSYLKSITDGIVTDRLNGDCDIAVRRNGAGHTGYIRGSGLYFVQTSFEAVGRGDTHG